MKDNLDLANEWLASQEEYDWTPLERALYGGGERRESDYEFHIQKESAEDSTD